MSEPGRQLASAPSVLSAAIDQTGQLVSPIADLLPHHYRELHEGSGLSDDIIRAAGIRSAENCIGLAAILRRKSYSRAMGPAMIFPYYDGSGAVVLNRVKPDNPGRGGKYLSPIGSISRAYVPPSVRPFLIDAEEPLFFTEGEKKTLRANQSGFPTIGLAGVENWHIRKSTALIPDLEAIPWNGREVYIVFDSDAAENPDVKRAECAFAMVLESRGAKVRIVRLPPGPKNGDGRPKKVGLDDFLVANGPDLFRELLARAVEPERPDPRLSSPTDDLSLEVVQGRTDVANARRLALQHGNDFRWCDPWGKWLIWDGRRWAVDEQRTVDELAKNVYRGLWEEIAEYVKTAGESDEDATLREMIRFAKQTGGVRSIQAMLALARSESDIAILPKVLDSDPWLFNCDNGTLDLRTGELRPHQQSDYLTKLCAVAFDTKADCPRWIEFLREITAGDDDLAKFLRKAVGLSLTGVVRDHVLFFLYGTGANGKSTFVGTLLDLLGLDFAMKAPPDMLLIKNAEGHPTERADLAGKRFVACVEAGEGRRLAESLVKELTGGDRVRARRMREDFWEFSPTHKIWLAANHKPVIRGTDRGIWRRIKLVPFTVAIPEENQDRKLAEKLKTELPGILNWAILGCLEWQHEGLGEPEAVRNATAEYRTESDVLGQFIDECCVQGGGAEVAATPLYLAYKAWAERSGERAIPQKAFGAALTERGFVNERFSSGPMKGRYRWFGIELNHSEV